ncbi:uncharacterized protein [Nicotiana tomentosiformis]|uniref:uncharacterized protein n=1 Tax=Nicotiana tomentosiformis TaxID=4098 RepID=UPI00388C9468
MRPSLADDDIYADPPTLKQDKEKKRGITLSSLSLEKKRPRKRLACKPKNANARELSSDSLCRLRDESEEEEDSELVTCVRSGSELLQAMEVVEEAMDEEFKRHEAVNRELVEKKDAYKLLNKRLQAELEASRKEHADLVEQVRRIFELSDDDSDTLANDSNPQVQKRLDQIEQLQVEVDTVKVETEEWKKNMDRLASKKETARVQLASAKVQLQVIREKYSVQVNMIEGLQSLLNSVVSGQENLAKELEAAKLEVDVVRVEADDKVAQYKADAEVIHDQAKNTVKHARWQSRKEALEGVHAQNFDVLAENKNAKIYEANARKLAYLEEDSEGSEESGESDGETPDED